jgi:hypothetical protein
MYVWIWRHLPFGKPGKLVGSLVLLFLAGALLWYVVFPWAEPLLPFDDVQVTESGVPGGSEDVGPVPGDGEPEPIPGDGHELPYATNRNNPPPTATPRR